MSHEQRNPTGGRRYRSRPSWPLVALAALLVGAFAVSCGASSGGEAQQAEQPREDPGGSGNPTLGAADAPVEMIEWGDFR